MTITEFCDKHGAANYMRPWALSVGAQTMLELWQREDMMPTWRIWIATRAGVLSEKDARLFACWCVRRVWHLLTDERSKTAIEVAERFANGQASSEELSAARDAARAAAFADWAPWVAWAAWKAAIGSPEATWDAAMVARASANNSDAARATQATHLMTYVVRL
jgi:hypothetical protein